MHLDLHAEEKLTHRACWPIEVNELRMALEPGLSNTASSALPPLSTLQAIAMVPRSRGCMFYPLWIACRNTWLLLVKGVWA